MFERQFGLRENPFAAGHQSRFVYPSREHQEALAHLRYGIENREPFVLITGEVGTGKTTALYDVLSEWQTRVTVALITNSALTRDELLEEICVRFGVGLAPGTTKPQLLMQLERHLLSVRVRGDRAILLLDEAQNLHRDLLEEIRLLSNLEAQGDKLMQVFLVGQPELEAVLTRPELRQLRQRIAVHYRLHPLSEDDTERYIHHRITVAGGHALTIFPADACRVVYELTHGIPREINTVCSQAMLNAFVEDSGMVMPEHVRAVARDTEFQSVMRGMGVTTNPGSVDKADEAPRERAREPEPASVPSEPPARREEPQVQAPPPPAPIMAPRESAPVAARESVAPAARGDEGPVSETRPRTSASNVRPAGTHEQWESVRANLIGDRAHAQPPPIPSPPSSAAPNPPDEVSHESESSTAHSQSESWYGPEPVPASRAAEEETSRFTPPSEPVMTPREVPSEPERPAMSSLPPTLRRKLEFIEEEEEPRPNGTMRWLAIAGVALVVIVGGVLAVRAISRSRQAARPPAVTPVQQPVTPAPADSTPRTETPATAPGTAKSPSSSLASGRATPRPAPPPPSAATSTTTPAAAKPAPTKPAATKPAPNPSTTPAAPPRSTSPTTSTTTSPERATKPRTEAPSGSFAIAVGTFLDETRANQERDKLGGSTGLAARVVPVTEGGDQVYRVVLGSFSDRAAAEKAAGRLIEAGSVDEARVITTSR